MRSLLGSSFVVVPCPIIRQHGKACHLQLLPLLLRNSQRSSVPWNELHGRQRATRGAANALPTCLVPHPRCLSQTEHPLHHQFTCRRHVHFMKEQSELLNLHLSNCAKDRAAALNPQASRVPYSMRPKNSRSTFDAKST